MVDQPRSDQPDQDLAAELVLNLLTGDKKAQALRLQLSDPLFAEEVAAWQRRLAPMFSEFEEVSPPENIWDATMRRLGTSSVAKQDSRRLSRSHVRLWKSLAITASVLSASLAFVLIRAPVPTPPAPATPQMLVVASLTGDTKGQVVTIAYVTSTGTLRIASTGLGFGIRSPELWAIPADGKPRSLGLIRKTGISRLIVSDKYLPLIVAGTTLAVTMEETATAPHNAPGSMPILVGKISVL